MIGARRTRRRGRSCTARCRAATSKRANWTEGKLQPEYERNERRRGGVEGRGPRRVADDLRGRSVCGVRHHHVAFEGFVERRHCLCRIRRRDGRGCGVRCGVDRHGRGEQGSETARREWRRERQHHKRDQDDGDSPIHRLYGTVMASNAPEGPAGSHAAHGCKRCTDEDRVRQDITRRLPYDFLICLDAHSDFGETRLSSAPLIQTFL